MLAGQQSCNGILNLGKAKMAVVRARRFEYIGNTKISIFLPPHLSPYPPPAALYTSSPHLTSSPCPSELLAFLSIRTKSSWVYPSSAARIVFKEESPPLMCEASMASGEGSEGEREVPARVSGLKSGEVVSSGQILYPLRCEGRTRLSLSF